MTKGKKCHSDTFRSEKGLFQTNGGLLMESVLYIRSDQNRGTRATCGNLLYAACENLLPELICSTQLTEKVNKISSFVIIYWL